MLDNCLVSVAEHKAHAPTRVSCFVLTISDTRTLETETSGRAIADLLAEHGHAVVDRTIVRDEPTEVARLVRDHAARHDVEAIITTGGTGLSRRDATYEALVTLFDKRLEGFGELFRALSFEAIGPPAMLSRACAGVVNGRILFALPGSEHAVRLAMTRLILPELGHIRRELTK
jgi:molybdenum cofactor biosynthesis protein B